MSKSTSLSREVSVPTRETSIPNAPCLRHFAVFIRQFPISGRTPPLILLYRVILVLFYCIVNFLTYHIPQFQYTMESTHRADLQGFNNRHTEVVENYLTTISSDGRHMECRRSITSCDIINASAVRRWRLLRWGSFLFLFFCKISTLTSLLLINVVQNVVYNSCRFMSSLNISNVLIHHVCHYFKQII